MRHVSLDQLQGKIVRPGFEKHLTPLLAYRGNMALGRAHRLWNLILSAKEHEASASDVAQRLVMNADYSQLCGPENKVDHITIRSFVGRLLDNPKVLAEEMHLAEYLRDMFPPHKGPIFLERISTTTSRRRNMGAGGWRTFKGKAKKQPLRCGPLVYPFLIHDGGKPEHDLLKRVNAAVNRSFKPHMRADICQDIIVGILSGEFSVENLALPVKEMTRRVFAMSMEKYQDLSLDAEIPGTDGLHWIDTLSNEDSIWERI